MRKHAYWKMILIILIIGMVFNGCKHNQPDSKYTPGEFTLVIAAGNNGEVGPCG